MTALKSAGMEIDGSYFENFRSIGAVVPDRLRNTVFPVIVCLANDCRAADERLWRSIKYEEAYLRAYASMSEARAGIGRYIGFYNGRRPHASLDGRTPDQACFNPLLPDLAAA